MVSAPNAFDPTEIAAWAKKLKEDNPEGRILSNQGGWQLEVDPQLPGAAETLSPIWTAAAAAFDDGLGLTPGLELTLDNVWVNISSPGDFNWDHTHPNSFFSGVAYIEASPESGDICFVADSHLDASNYLLKPEIRQKYNMHGRWNFSPEAGSILIFSSSLVHRVYPNKSPNDRISIAFNLQVRKI